MPFENDSKVVSDQCVMESSGTTNCVSTLDVKDASAVEAMKRISGMYPRYGYRRIRIVLSREGHAMSPSRAERLWRTAKLQLPAK